MCNHQYLIKLFKTLYTVLALVLLVPVSYAATDLADRPLFSGSTVPGNVAIAISAEFPTPLGSAYTGSYNNATDYIGYFDFKKCYTYHSDANVELRYFQPVTGVVTLNHQCNAQWSGNFLNYALTQTIDPFRKALTGGYRSVDTADTTVLEKAYASGQGGGVNTPTIGANANLYTPFPWASLSVRISGLGKTFRITGNGDLNSAGVEINGLMPVNPPTNNVYFLYARANVCVIGQLEDNCTQYGANYKPTGLIQKNSAKLNFAALGYLNDSSNNPQRDGAVLRAAMGQVGPLQTNPNAVSTANPKAEWDANTGIFNINPDPNAANASGVTNSGVINYLNKFGLAAQSFKTYDPVSELYYTASRYYRNKGNVASYTNNLNAGRIDGFPVITNWDDPVKYSCQANFIIGIGDTNSWNDGNLPGSIQRNGEPAIPPEVNADLGNGDMSPAATQIVNNLNVTTATDRVGAIQGIGNTLTTNYTGASGATYLMAGMAYDLHTRDMRPDFTGKQTVTTYWLDVLESGFRNDGGTRFNAFYLAAKYGGFDVPANYDPYSAAVTPLTVVQWDKTGAANGGADGDPDNYFRANNPALMIKSLGTAFDKIVNSLQEFSSSFVSPTNTIKNGTITYASSYSNVGWIGEVTASTTTLVGKVETSTLAWNASDRLDTKIALNAGTGWDTSRLITTAKCTPSTLGQQTCTPIPFRLANLSASQTTDLGATNTQQTLNFLRGDRSNEDTATVTNNLYRKRLKALGDIGNSKVIPVGSPNEDYSDAFNPGYSSFKSSYANRSTVVYVGANDGMLHAFNGAATGAATDGAELFAYIPNATFKGPNNIASIDGLVQLSSKTYDHRYYVDATPIVRDVNFGGGNSDWHSLLISGLGKGGKSYFAIDVTDPASMTTENAVASKVKWEFTHIDMGFTYDIPLIVKTARDGWVAVFTSGYNNTDGKGYFFVVKLADGSLIQRIPVNDINQTAGTDAGLAHVGPFIADKYVGIADAAYAGDLLGNVWRLDLRDPGVGNAYPAPLRFAMLTDANGTAQPVTTAPVVNVDARTSKRYVFVGTGKLLATSDINNTQLQTFYGINDGTSAVFSTTATLPTTPTLVTFPIQRANLNNDSTTMLAGIGTAPTNPMGYYVDLGAGPNAVPYRVNVELTSGAGSIAFIANLTEGDACNPGGSYKTYALDYGTGKSTITVGGALVSNLDGLGLGTGVSISNFDDGVSQSVEIRTSNNGGGGGGGGSLSTPGSSIKQLNWRELPTLN